MEARAAFIAHLSERSGSVGGGLPRTIEEHLPNVVFQPPTGADVQLGALVVVGDVDEVTAGRAFRNALPPAGIESSELPFDDPTADWRTLHLEVDVVEPLGEGVGSRLRVGVAISGSEDPRPIMDGAEALGRVVLLLSESNGVFAYDPSVIGMVAEGRYLITVDDDGSLHLPVLASEEARAFQGDIRTLDDLRRAAAEPTRVIPVAEPAPGYYERVDRPAVPPG